MVLTMHSSVSLAGVKPWIHHTWVKIAPLSSENDPALGTSLVVLWLRLYAPTAGVLGPMYCQINILKREKMTQLLRDLESNGFGNP